jgi:hypothetical protein
MCLVVCMETQFVPHREHSARITKTSWLMPQGEIMVVYCDSRTEPTGEQHT